MKDNIRWAVAAVLWTAAVALMIAGTIRPSTLMMHWGIFVALGAGSVTTWVVIDCATYRERVRVDRLVERVVDRMKQESDMPRIQR